MNPSNPGKSLAWLLAAPLAMALHAPAHADINGDAKADLLWHNHDTGQVGAWLLDGAAVTGMPMLSLGCGWGNGCEQAWRPVGPIGASRLLWHNPQTGELSSWLLNGTTVTATSPLDLKCGPSNGCSQNWKAVGTGAFHTSNYRYGDVLWHNAGTGELGIWLVNGTTVETQMLDLRCGPANGCSTHWKVVGVTRHGPPAILWHNASTGELGYWYLKDTPSVHPAPVNSFRNLYYTSVASVSPSFPARCGPAMNCASTWRVIGLDDVDHDGRDDVVWFNAQSGEVTAWLMNGLNVTGTLTLSARCPSSNCSTSWFPLGLMTGS